METILYEAEQEAPMKSLYHENEPLSYQDFRFSLRNRPAGL